MGKSASCIGVENCCPNCNFGVRHAARGFRSAGVGFEIRGDIFVHLHIHASVINHAFTIKNIASGGVRDKQNLLIILSAFAAGDFKFNRKLRGAHVFIKARPNHVARGANIWCFRELSKHLVGRQAHIDGRRIQVLTSNSGFNVANVAQCCAGENHWKIVFIANKTPTVGAEYWNAACLLAEICGGELCVLSIVIGNQRQCVRAIVKWTHFF